MIDVTRAIEVLHAYADGTLEADAGLIEVLDTAIVDAYNKLMETASDYADEEETANG